LEFSTQPFSDGDVIYLSPQDALIYAEEVNTQLLTKNFDIEVFVTASSTSAPSMSDPSVPTTRTHQLERKYFHNIIPQIENGFMISSTIQTTPPTTYTTASVEYYFDLLVDQEIDPTTACRGAEVFNKQSYYVDLDFDCEEEQDEFSVYDIYGAVTEPEICLD